MILPAPDKNEILRALKTLIDIDDIAELRIIHNKRKRTDAGYFDFNHWNNLASIAAENNKNGNVYITMNPFNRQLHSRYYNRLEDFANATTKDDDVTSRRWLLIDCDPKRPKDTSSTDKQLNAAKKMAETILDELRDRGFPEPVQAMSGNGFHLLYRVELPNTDDVKILIQSFLEWLDKTHGNAEVNIDKTVFNAGRITKLYGTVAKKGDHTPEMPHRLSRLTNVPEQLDILDRNIIEQCLPPAPTAKNVSQRSIHNGTPYNLDDFLVRLGIPFTQDIHSGNERYKLDHCPFNPDHGKGESAIFRMPDGTLGFKCQHDSCSDKHWKDLREYVDGKQSEYVPNTITSYDIECCDEPDLLTDQRIKKYFAELYRGLVHYVPGVGWLVWDGKRWSTDTPGGLYPFISQMVRQLWEQSETIQDEDARIKRRKSLIGLESHGRQTTIIEACQTVPSLIKNANQLDQDPMLLNCLNGTLNLRTGTIQPHSPHDLITRMINIEYDPVAECPAFQMFISWAMRGEAALISYLQRFTGYCLTGRTDEQVLNFWYGTGGNGKTTLMNVIQWLLGDYASTADTGLIMQRRNGTDSNRLSMLAGLRGSRIVTLSEVNDGEKLDEAAIKSFTGGDIITCRHLYEDFFSYTPQAKLIGFGNYKPHVRGTDNGIWRRIHLVPFMAVISDEDKDPSLPEKLRAELPGILTWAVKGCLEWQRIGLSAPGAILEATREYRQAEDVFSNWLNECCATSQWDRTATRELFDSFKRFSGWNSITPTRFGKMLSDHGLTKTKSNGKVYWEGLTLEISDTSDSYPPFSQKSIRKNDSKSFVKTPSTVTSVTGTEQAPRALTIFSEAKGRITREAPHEA